MLPGGIPNEQFYVYSNSNSVTLPVSGPSTSNHHNTKSSIVQSCSRMNCLLFNARSVVANLADFHYVLYNCNYDIVLVTESWLTESDTTGLLDPEGAYSIVRRDRLHTVGGGVCIAVRRELKYIEVCCTAAGSVEMLCVDVVCFNSKYRFIVIYRPPHYRSNARDNAAKLVESLEALCQVAWPVFIVGDLNCPGVNWQTNCAPSDGVQDKLLDCVVEYGFTQCVTLPTRGANVLDLVLVNEPLLLSSLSVLDPVGNSDHDSVQFCIAVEPRSYATTDNGCTEKPVLMPRYIWQHADYEGISSYLSQVDWQSMMSHNLTTDSLWSSFCDILQTALDLYVPTRPPRLSHTMQSHCKK